MVRPPPAYSANALRAEVGVGHSTRTRTTVRVPERAAQNDAGHCLREPLRTGDSSQVGPSPDGGRGSRERTSTCRLAVGDDGAIRDEPRAMGDVALAIRLALYWTEHRAQDCTRQTAAPT